MAITTFDELKSAINNWLERTESGTRLAEFIALAEADLNRRLRVEDMVTSTTVTTVSGTSTIAKPSGFLQFKSSPYLSTTPITKLDLVGEDYINERYIANESGKPLVFTMEGANLKLAPTPGSAYTVNIKYYKRITGLDDANPTNDILTNYPDLYLYGSLVAAQGYLDNDVRTAQWKNLYDLLLNDVNSADKESLLLSTAATSDYMA